MNLVGNVFFAVMALVSLVGGVATVASRNPIRGAIGLLATIVGIAGMFLKLNAQFMAAIQLIVYAGAVVVLFVFVMMLLGPDAGAAPPGIPKARLARAAAGVAIVLVMGIGAGMILMARPSTTHFQPVRPEHGSVELVGRQLFTQGIVPFELATALLIVAVVGAIAVARSSHLEKKTKKKVSASPTERLFHGPLHPRDAGRPLTGEEL